MSTRDAATPAADRRPHSGRTPGPPARARMLRMLLLLVAAAGLAPAIATAQEARYELGRRVRDFERAWDTHPDAGARERAAVELDAAVQSFFRMRLGEAGRSISRARAALDGDPEAPPDRRWAAALAVRPESRLIDTARPELGLTLDAFYPPGVDRPAGARVRVTLRPAGAGAGADGAGGASREQAIEALPLELRLPLAGVPAGDHTLVAEVLGGEPGTALATLAVGVSAVDRLAERLDAAAAAIAAWPAEAPPERATDRATAHGLLDQLRALAAGRVTETDIPAAAWVAELEAMLAEIAAGRPYLGPDRPGPRWISLALPGGRTVPARLFVPEAARAGGPLPIVVALHGAGGSENLFFDGYGAGAVVGLCRDRGWLVVAPRGGAFGGGPAPDEVATALAKLYPVDPRRVFVVGHSMGAMQAVAAAGGKPERFAAVAALGGGGRLKGSEPLKALPFFVGVGSRDFALDGARALNRTLTGLGVTSVTFREYPGIEHLAIVQVALPDVFAFFDRVAAAAP